jgi:hypothetical protein
MSSNPTTSSIPSKMSLSKTSKYIVVLPCEGSPFIWKNRIFNTKTKDGKTELFNESRKVVRGDVESIDPASVRIHPMFENRWSIAQQLLREKDVEVYANEDGIRECSPNMGTLIGQKDFSSVSGKSITFEMMKALPIKYRPLHGEIALIVPHPVLVKHITPAALKLVRVEDHYDAMGVKPEDFEPSDEDDYERRLGGYIFEPYDGTDSKKFKDYVKSKGWFIGSFGQVFECPTGRPDEKESADYDSESDDE